MKPIMNRRILLAVLTFCSLAFFIESKEYTGCPEQSLYEKGKNRLYIPDSSYTASSYYKSPKRENDARYKPSSAKLHGKRGWAACSDNNTNDYLQIDLGTPRVIIAVATQGTGFTLDKEWVTEYKLMFARNETLLRYPYKDECGKLKIFKGNTDPDSVVRHNLTKPQLARYIRFIPVAFHTWKTIRVNVYVVNQSCCPLTGCASTYEHCLKYTFVPDFTLKSNDTSKLKDLELKYNGILTFQVIIEKINSTSEITTTLQLPDNIPSANDRLVPPPLYITAQVTGRRVTLGDGKIYGNYKNIRLQAGSSYRVYVRVVRKDDKGKTVYSDSKSLTFSISAVEKPSSNLENTAPSIVSGSKSYKWYSEHWLVIVLVSIIVVLTIVIILVVIILKRGRRKAKEKREKELKDKNMYMSIDEAIELKTKAEGTLTKKTSETSIRKERTYATLGETNMRPATNTNDSNKAYASLDEATRFQSEPEPPKAPTTLYESLNNLDTCTGGRQYETLDKVKNEVEALAPTLNPV